MKTLRPLALFVACLSTSFMTTLTANAKNINLNPIDVVFSDKVLSQCQFEGPYFSDLYFSGFDIKRRKLVNNILYIDNSSRYNMDPKYTTGLPVVKFTGIKAMKEINYNTREKIENVLQMDIDVLKHDLNILQFANFSGHYYVYKNGEFSDDYEGSGFYYIIKGLPEVNKPKLRALAKNGLADNMAIEETPDGNTRVICDW